MARGTPPGQARQVVLRPLFQLQPKRSRDPESGGVRPARHPVDLAERALAREAVPALPAVLAEEAVPHGLAPFVGLQRELDEQLARVHTVPDQLGEDARYEQPGVRDPVVVLLLPRREFCERRLLEDAPPALSQARSTTSTAWR